MSEIIFKATRRASGSSSGYRQITKRGDLHADQAASSDDVIILYPDKIDGGTIIIDCDLKTGEFHLKFNSKKP